MSKKMLIAFITASMAQAVQKTAVDRLKYIPAGIKNGVVFSWKGGDFGEFDAPDCVWIPKSELDKSRIADANFAKYQQAMLQCLAGDVDTDADEDGDDDVKASKSKKTPVKEDCDALVLEDIEEALGSDDLEDAEAMLGELQDKDVIKRAKALIKSYKASDEDGDDDDNEEWSDDDRLEEVKAILSESDTPTDADIEDVEALIDEMVNAKNAKKAQKMLDDAMAADDLTEDEAISEIKLAIKDGDAKEAKELLKFIETPVLLRRWTRKVKGM